MMIHSLNILWDDSQDSLRAYAFLLIIFGVHFIKDCLSSVQYSCAKLPPQFRLRTQIIINPAPQEQLLHKFKCTFPQVRYSISSHNQPALPTLLTFTPQYLFFIAILPLC